ncbi:MAG TPA: hypothetical protein VN456_05870 [Desulfosporosinus sp.]|nr:hypothetical protein [Desulfosporosinus sp.]
MSRLKIINLVLIIGLGIGVLVPVVTSWWYDRDRSGFALNVLQAEAAATNQAAAKVKYHFGLKQGVLSVIEGEPGENGKVILTGLDVEAWPKEMLEMAPKVEFYSLDEVQSFIDTVNEPLWRE